MWADGVYIVNGLGLTNFDESKLKNINLDPRNSIVLNSLMFYVKKIQGKLVDHDKQIAKLQINQGVAQGGVASNAEAICKIQGSVVTMKKDTAEMKSQLEDNQKMLIEQIMLIKKELEEFKKEAHLSSDKSKQGN